MLTTALLVMFAAHPALLSEGAPRAARLVAAVPLAPPSSDLPTYEGWTKAQLRQEYERLKETRPGIALPITLMGSGGGALILSLYVLFFGVLASNGFTSAAVPFLAVFGVMGTGGAAMLIIGGILLSRALPDRRIFGAQMNEVDRLIKEGDDPPGLPDQRQYVPPPDMMGPPPEGPPPPPLPPYTPQASLTFPLIFARF